MWWQYVVFVAVLVLVIYLFMLVVGFRTRLLTRKTDRTAESMYDEFADSPRKQRKFARKHGGEWRVDDSQADDPIRTPQ
jgi:hypothetical protein